MHPRYYAPDAQRIWSDEARIHRLRSISDQYTIDAIERDLLRPHRFVGSLEQATHEIQSPPDPHVDDWKSAEFKFGHEIVGFLQVYLDRLPSDLHPFVHFGLTSSDLVEYDIHAAAWEHAQLLYERLQRLRSAISDRAKEHTKTARAGRTHGQVAELTNLNFQLASFDAMLDQIGVDLYLDHQRVPMKSPGPTGFSLLRNWPTGSTGWPVLSTQVIPRDWLLRWACSYLRLANALEQFATFIRFGCRSEVGEFQEGGSLDRQGSSAMPGKNNPIDSERVCGLARVARGHFLSIAEVSNLWEDRDLSNSSTERIAIPDLAAVVEHMTLTMTNVVATLLIDEERIAINAADPRTQTNARQCEIQRTRGVGPIQASELVRKEQISL